MIVAVIILAGLTSALVAIAILQARREDALEARLGALQAIHDRQEAALRSMVTPLAWVHLSNVDDRLVRHGAAAAFEAVRMGLALDLDEMGGLMSEVPDPPRRMPRYPQVPPYLARPEDVAQVPSGFPFDIGADTQAEAHLEIADRLRDTLGDPE